MSPEVSPPHGPADAPAPDARWKLAFEANGDGVWDRDIPSGRVDFSAGLKTMLGFPVDEPWNNLGDWSGRVHPDDLPGVMAAVEDHLAGRSAADSCEHRPRCADGSWKWVLDRGMVLDRDGDGVPRGTLTSALRFYDDVFVDPEERRATRDRVAQELASTGRLRWDDVPLTTRSGERRWVTATTIPIPERQIMVATVQDVTHTHMAAEALKRQTDHLRERNAELVRFNRAAVDRELRMVDLKREVNALLARPGEPPRYADYR